MLIGILLIIPIGGADTPVVVSMLNSYSGFAAAATGFMLGNDLLIIAGALVGSSGAILSYIMCKAMNRSFLSVILGGFGVKKAVVSKGNKQELSYCEITPMQVANMLKNCKKVLVTPGYGMATAKAQHSLASLYDILFKMNIELTFGVHPVAGRMPGHMNVLLAEANIDYDKVYELDEINNDFKDIDCVLVIGANDTVNPSAIDDKDSPIAGMPVLKVWEAKNVIVFKRGFNAGYAGVDNPLFFKPNTKMLFGDAKISLDEIIKSI
jgi:NAD(P) transhydrogenase subunit beta